jgi:hypothetical protein
MRKSLAAVAGTSLFFLLGITGYVEYQKYAHTKSAIAPSAIPYKIYALNINTSGIPATTFNSPTYIIHGIDNDSNCFFVANITSITGTSMTITPNTAIYEQLNVGGLCPDNCDIVRQLIPFAPVNGNLYRKGAGTDALIKKYTDTYSTNLNVLQLKTALIQAILTDNPSVNKILLYVFEVNNNLGALYQGVVYTPAIPGQSGAPGTPATLVFTTPYIDDNANGYINTTISN